MVRQNNSNLFSLLVVVFDCSDKCFGHVSGVTVQLRMVAKFSKVFQVVQAIFTFKRVVKDGLCGIEMIPVSTYC